MWTPFSGSFRFERWIVWVDGSRCALVRFLQLFFHCPEPVDVSDAYGKVGQRGMVKQCGWRGEHEERVGEDWWRSCLLVRRRPKLRV